VITSGGELARRAERDGVPVLQIPPGLPPRAAVGYLLGGLLGLLDPFFPESNDRRLAAAADAVKRLNAGETWDAVAKSLGACAAAIIADRLTASLGGWRMIVDGVVYVAVVSVTGALRADEMWRLVTEALRARDRARA